MASPITCHEEVRDSVRDLGGVAHAQSVANDLNVSASTARRYLEEMVTRGWATRTRVVSRSPYNGRYVPMVTYALTVNSEGAEW